MNKEEFMKLALKQAEIAYKEDEVPIGCVIVFNNEVIAKAHNKKEKKNCAIHHAEIEAISRATKVLNSWHLDECEMYVTLEPCLMCTGAIINSRIKKVYYGTKDPKGGSLESNIKLIDIKNLNHYPKYESGILEEECASILKKFFKTKR